MKNPFTFLTNHRVFLFGKEKDAIANYAPSFECEAIIKHFLNLQNNVTEDHYGSLYIGWGHSALVEKNLVVDASEAQTFLMYDLEKISKTVKKMIRKYRKTNPVLSYHYPNIPQSVFDALVVFGFFYGKTHLMNMISQKDGHEMKEYTFINCSHDETLEKLIETLTRMYTGDGHVILDVIWDSDYEFFMDGYPFGLHQRHTEYLKKTILDPCCLKI